MIYCTYTEGEFGFAKMDRGDAGFTVGTVVIGMQKDFRVNLIHSIHEKAEGY